jgi:hypothetical protein
MWAWILRRREGVRYRYQLQLTVEAASFATAAQPGSGTVAVDIGQRELLPAGDLRVAAWLDAEGKHGTIELPQMRLSSPASHGQGRRRAVPDDLGKVEDVQAIRSRMLDDMRDRLVAYRHHAGQLTDQGLDKLMERLAYVHAWRSPARVAALLRDWLAGWRHDGDEVIIEHMRNYLTQDRHLCDWENNERRRHFARRDQTYRDFAARLANAYDTIVLADRDYRRSKRPAEQASDGQGHESRVIMRHAAPGKLHRCIEEAAQSRGRRVVLVEIEGDTSWTTDARVCERLLASASAAPQAGEALATPNAGSAKSKRSNVRPRRLGTPVRLDPLAGQDVTRQHI